MIRRTSIVLCERRTFIVLCDPDYGTPARVDILLGRKVFSKAVIHGRRDGPTRALLAFMTCFGWVLNGETRVNVDRAWALSAVLCSNLMNITLGIRRVDSLSRFRERQTCLHFENLRLNGTIAASEGHVEEFCWSNAGVLRERSFTACSCLDSLYRLRNCKVQFILKLFI